MVQYKRQALQQKITSNVDVQANGCWIWRGSAQTGGYGQVGILGKRWMAHRLSWYAFHKESCDGKLVCHSCDTPLCCNPKHLWLGTPAQNRQAAIQKGRLKPSIDPKHSRKTRRRKLSDDDVRAIRASTGPLQPVADQYNTTIQNVSLIRNGHRKKLVI